MPTIEPVPMQDIAPDVRATLEKAVADGRMASPTFLQIVAYNGALLRMHASAYQREQPSLLSARLRELIRVRSAQIAGCDECQAARYDETVTDKTAACLIAGTQDELDEREALVMRFVTKMHLDHHSIDGAFYRALARFYSIAEIVEIGQLTATLLGAHRWIHTLDLLGKDATLSYSRAEVDTKRQGCASTAT
ncbi:MAG: carboxymuconolactone decarboxylase family protein [Steroidobacteraceae bacterium]